MRSHALLSGLLLVVATGVFGAVNSPTTEQSENASSAVYLSELAAKADLVAVAQVKDTDYVYTRSFPSEGSAFLRILIAYKQNRPGEEIIEVVEKGLHANECYFENPTVFEEGRRYLIFFRISPDQPETYKGMDEGCALEILVTEDNRYALKYPLVGIHVADNLDELVQGYTFRDNYAVVADESLSPGDRNNLLERGLIKPYQDGFKFTHGVDLTSARNLISPAALKPGKPR